MIILAIGILTLVFYALNPVEMFDTNFQSVVTQWNNLTPDQQQAVRDQVQKTRVNTGIVDPRFLTSGAYQPNPYANQPINTDSDGQPLNVSYNGEVQQESSTKPVTAVTTGANANGQFIGEFMGQFIHAPSDQVLLQKPSIQQSNNQSISVDNTLPSLLKNITPASLLQQTASKDTPTIMTPNLSCGSTVPTQNNSNYNDLLKAQLAAQDAQDEKDAKHEKQRKHKMDRLQQEKQQQQQNNQMQMKQQREGASQQQIDVQYVQKYCPPPDPNVWIKKSEIPCWGCSV